MKKLFKLMETHLNFPLESKKKKSVADSIFKYCADSISKPSAEILNSTGNIREYGSNGF